MSLKPLNRRIPGILPPPPKTELDGKITDLSNKTIAELKELRDRQVKLLNNKSFLSKLTDKGKKINELLTKILNELKNKEEELQTCSMLEKLNINGVTNIESVQDIEWRRDNTVKRDAVILDSDDDSEPEDVLQIICQSTAQEKIVKVLPPERPLIAPEDLLSIGETPHVKYIVDKTELNTNIPHEKFKPHKTTKSDVHDPAKEVCRKKGKHWEVTAATPPPILHGPAKALTIEESLKLQKEHNIHLKEIEAQHAAEKLMAKIGVKIEDLPGDTTSFGNYREAVTEMEDSDPEGSDKEVHDEEPEKGGVIFTVMK